ncbi:hypothetical protein IGI04_013445 [Brassica rapa subsp. trilocularis]|uniref:Uncharacterized protein n=1 Tax=Brassica rapa subsp. trilocularis TaxID=1813537 RepID=A0ABQ7N8U8_BRACM|nr:hypothetical protein IGI04_013445 [Brassica rapa subsp. trilocularis]
MGLGLILDSTKDDEPDPYTRGHGGIDFKRRTIELDTKRIKLQIWDTAGQERFRTITTAYYRWAMGILLVYDVTDESSFNNIRNWICNIEQHASDNVNKILVGNKADMDESKRSAKTNLNVEEVFFSIAKDIKQRLPDTDSRAEDEKKCITSSFCDMLFIAPGDSPTYIQAPNGGSGGHLDQPSHVRSLT